MNKFDPIATRIERDAPAGGDLVSLADIWSAAIGFIRRRFISLALCVLVTASIGALYLLTTPPSFTSTAVLLIDTNKLQLFQERSVLADMAVDAATVESQVQVLTSETIAAQVVDQLRLVNDPEFTHPRRGFIGTLMGFATSHFAGAVPRSEADLRKTAIGYLRGNLSAQRVGLTYVINISFRSLNPVTAANVANAVADAYVVDQLNAKYQATRRASVWLQDRIDELRGQTSAAERAVVDYKSANNIVDTGGGALLNEQQLTEINTQLVLARAATSEARARLNRIEDIISSGDPAATVTDTLSNAIVTDLRSKYLDMSQREADWSARYGKNHLAAIKARNQMQELQNSIVAELRRLREVYKSDLEIAIQREQNLSTQLATVISESKETNEAQIQLRELESEAQTYRLLYENFLQRYMETVQQQSFPVSEARLISRADPGWKSHPKTMLIVAFSVISGLMVGGALGVVRDLSDRVFRSSGQLENSLGVSCVAVVPAIKADKGLKRAKLPANAPPRTVVLTERAVASTVIHKPFSRYTEAIRSIKLVIDHHHASIPHKIVGMTSSMPKEGKSTLAASLALLIAQSGSRTLLIDCDLRNPSLSRDLARGATEGLIEVAMGSAKLEDVLWTEPASKLEFLPTVVSSRLAHTTEILASQAIARLFAELRKNYEYVIVDLSPLAPVVDVRATYTLVDSYLFVAEWGRTKRDVVEHALDTTPGLFPNLLGSVLNKANIDVVARYDGHLSDYYSNKLYSHYGYTE